MILLVVSCKTKTTYPNPPPPMADSAKCVVDVYDDDLAKVQHCLHVGYIWKCETISRAVGSQCVRLGEANGERPLTNIGKVRQEVNEIKKGE